MTTIRYNPLTYSDKLIESRMKVETAKVIAQQQEEFYQRIDFDDIEITKQELKNEIKESQLTIIKWVIGIAIAQTGLILTVISFIIKHT